MDNGTMVEVFKHLNYYQLAKNSLVSKRFWNMIQTHRHKLALLFVDWISMDNFFTSPFLIKTFDQKLSLEAYNDWVVRNGYSKQIPPESELAGLQSTQNDPKVYELSAYVAHKDPNRRPNTFATVFFARVELNHENWPLFQHFVRLLTDPFVYIRYMKLTTKSDAAYTLSRVVNPDSNRLQCKVLSFDLDGNIQKSIGWVKNSVRYDELQIFDCRSTNPDEELLDFLITGTHYSSKKFMDLKNKDECQVVGSIRGNVSYESADVLKHKYGTFMVKEERLEGDGNTRQVFEFVNHAVGKKLQLGISFFRHTYSTQIRLNTAQIQLNPHKSDSKTAQIQLNPHKSDSKTAQIQLNPHKSDSKTA
ncbi:hypothetical protein Ddc_18850 [Ditylenchus destructor]|nr:hypothetical protein Ddc_18850 [Ditylenchus destructor]